MSSIVGQGLQSCLEPRLIEPLVLSHRLAPPSSNNPRANSQNENNNGEQGGWSLIQNISDSSQNCEEVNGAPKIYVPPTFKRSSSKMSTKSLEMCTECLGSETGSENGDEFSLLPREGVRIRGTWLSRSQEFTKNLGGSGSGSYPPPLTSISGSDSVQVRPHREGGRLVIKAVTVSNCSAYFQAERVDGRLRLCLLRDCSPDCDNHLVQNEVEQSEEEEEDVREQEIEAETEQVEEEDDDDDDKDFDCDNGCGLDHSWGNIGDLPRRCNEGGSSKEGISIWGPYWVPIS